MYICIYIFTAYPRGGDILINSRDEIKKNIDTEMNSISQKLCSSRRSSQTNTHHKDPFIVY